MIDCVYHADAIPNAILQQGLYIYGCCIWGKKIGDTHLKSSIIAYFDRSAADKIKRFPYFSKNWKIYPVETLCNHIPSTDEYINLLIAVRKQYYQDVVRLLESISVHVRIIRLDYDKLEGSGLCNLNGQLYLFDYAKWIRSQNDYLLSLFSASHSSVTKEYCHSILDGMTAGHWKKTYGPYNAGISISGINSSYYHTACGMRVTVNNVITETPNTNIHIFGDCRVWGGYAEDCDTMPSFLYENLTAASVNSNILNHGIFSEDVNSIEEIAGQILSIDMHRGDIAILLLPAFPAVDSIEEREIKIQHIFQLISACNIKCNDIGANFICCYFPLLSDLDHHNSVEDMILHHESKFLHSRESMCDQETIQYFFSLCEQKNILCLNMLHKCNMLDPIKRFFYIDNIHIGPCAYKFIADSVANFLLRLDMQHTLKLKFSDS